MRLWQAVLACGLSSPGVHGQATVVEQVRYVKQRPDTPTANAPNVQPVMDLLKDAIAELKSLRPPDGPIQPPKLDLPPIDDMRAKTLPNPPVPPVRPPFRWPKFDWTFNISTPRLDLSDLTIPKPAIPPPNYQPDRPRLTDEDKYLMKEILKAAKDYNKSPVASPAPDPYRIFKEFFKDSTHSMRDMEQSLRYGFGPPRSSPLSSGPM